MDETKFRKYVAYCRWVWLVGSVVSLVSAVVALLVLPGTLTAVLAVVTGVQAVLSIPAAIALPRRASWARITLMVLALFSIAGLYTAFKSGGMAIAGAQPGVGLDLRRVGEQRLQDRLQTGSRTEHERVADGPVGGQFESKCQTSRRRR